MQNNAYVVVDVETTGKGVHHHRMTEICAVRIEDGIIVDKFVSLINPEQRIPNYITDLTGITDEMVRYAPTFGEVAKRIYDITKDVVFVAHSVYFDFNVIRAEFRMVGYDFDRKLLCTKRLSQRLIPHNLSYGLGRLCNTLGINLIDRHRAEGDCDATVVLFLRLVALDEDGSVRHGFLNPMPKPINYPPHIEPSAFNGLPGSAGIYKFMDKAGKIIYVGKAKNIKTRVLSHFRDASAKEIELCAHTHSFDVETTGGELIALLYESHLIQQHVPEYNKVQKTPRFAYRIISYKNRKGTIQLGVEKKPYTFESNEVFYRKKDAVIKIRKLCEEFELCPKYCGLLTKKKACGDDLPLLCKGICADSEDVGIYNQRVCEALQAMARRTETFLIKQPGRNPQEKGFVFIRAGVYQGFGFLGEDEQLSSMGELLDHITLRKHSYFTDQIITKYRKTNPRHLKFIEQ